MCRDCARVRLRPSSGADRASARSRDHPRAAAVTRLLVPGTSLSDPHSPSFFGRCIPARARFARCMPATFYIPRFRRGRNTDSSSAALTAGGQASTPACRLPGLPPDLPAPAYGRLSHKNHNFPLALANRSVLRPDQWLARTPFRLLPRPAAVAAAGWPDRLDSPWACAWRTRGAL